MVRSLIGFSMAVAVVAATPAEARFGKGGSPSGSHSSPSSPPSSTTHSAVPVNSGGAYRAQPVGPSATRYAYVPSYGYGYGPGYGFYGSRYGYGYGYYGPGYFAAPGAVVTSGEVARRGAVVEEQTPLRVTAGVEGQGYAGSFSAGSNGVTLAALVSVEGERWGFSASASNIAVKADDGTNRFDNIQSLTAHLTFAVLNGQYGRLRLEAGADSFFAPSAIFLGPTGGVSGVLWLGGPVGIEASAMLTPWPFRQVDARLGVAVGIGMVGLRAGWRVQTLDDLGLVDGVRHVDAFNGPYVGVSLVF